MVNVAADQAAIAAIRAQRAITRRIRDGASGECLARPGTDVIEKELKHRGASTVGEPELGLVAAGQIGEIVMCPAIRRGRSAVDVVVEGACLLPLICAAWSVSPTLTKVTAVKRLIVVLVISFIFFDKKKAGPAVLPLTNLF